MNTELAGQIIQVDDEAITTARHLAREEGILTGISGGANVFASLKVGKTMEKGGVIVTIIPDNVFRYFSTELFKQ